MPQPIKKSISVFQSSISVFCCAVFVSVLPLLYSPRLFTVALNSMAQRANNAKQSFLFCFGSRWWWMDQCRLFDGVICTESTITIDSNRCLMIFCVFVYFLTGEESKILIDRGTIVDVSRWETQNQKYILKMFSMYAMHAYALFFSVLEVVRRT